MGRTPSRGPAPTRATVIRSLALATALTATAVLAFFGGLAPDALRKDGPSRIGSDGAGGEWSAPEGHRPDPGRLSVGVTHTQYSIDDWGSKPAIASAKAVLTATASYQNQHIYGWGAENPQPRPGSFNWSSLDRRMKLIRSTSGTPVITLCCAPDWMKGGRPGETNWDRLEVAPRPEHYADFAALAAAVARRYPDVRHFLVWNELKGFWNESENRWDYESYTRLYNMVYAALKAVNPAIAVGGPYVVVDTWADKGAGGHPSRLVGTCGTVDQRSLDVLTYWLRNMRGADFIVVDAGAASRDLGAATTAEDSALFGALTRWLRQRTDLPVWWSEFHVGRAGSDGQQRLVTNAVAALLHMAEEGAAAAFYWQPQATAEDTHGVRQPALWSSTAVAGGGRPLPLAEALARMQHLLADPDPGLVSWPVPEVGVLNGRGALLAVNTEAHRVTARIRGVELNLGPYDIRYVPLPRDAPPAPPRGWSPGVDQCLGERPQQPQRTK